MPVERSGQIGFFTRNITCANCTLLLMLVDGVFHAFAHGGLQGNSTRMMVSARITVLNPNDKIPCTRPAPPLRDLYHPHLKLAGGDDEREIRKVASRELSSGKFRDTACCCISALSS